MVHLNKVVVWCFMENVVALTKSKKSDVVSKIGQMVSSSSLVVAAEYRGISVKQLTSLRVQAREENVSIAVLKNTLVSIALKGTAFESVSNELKGPLLYGFSADPVSAARVLVNFAKTNDKLVVKAGVLPGKFLSNSQIMGLANLPSRDVLLAKLLATLSAPTTNFFATLYQVPTSFVRLLSEVKQAKS
jgi:large subunit ribosomal protein L10